MQSVKQLVARMSARWLRSALIRIADDLELLQIIRAALQSLEFAEAEMAGSVAFASKGDVLLSALAQATRPGFICELGVYRGRSLNEIARRVRPEKVYGFDTFAGLPEDWRNGFEKGTFDVSGERLTFESNCVLYKGLFEESLPRFLAEVEGPARFIHVDCDLYASTSTALELLAPRIQPGTVIVFDEYFNYPGWQQHECRAFNEFLEKTGRSCRYIAYNKFGQQVAVRIG